MAATSLLALIDDIASVLDDVAMMTKLATKKTAPILGDDLALNAQQVAGVRPRRELPVVWAVARGSLKNKAILVPAALIIGSFAPWAITPLLMIGGLFLCFEGFEKLAHKLLHDESEDRKHKIELRQAAANVETDMVAFEKGKIKGAIRTDFILSAEIIAITLGAVAGAIFLTQLAVLTGMAIIMTVGVYGLVAVIIKLDDAGLHLSQRSGRSWLTGLQRSIGKTILLTAPYMMKTLSILGMAAMFMVGGGILTHGIPGAHEVIHHIAEAGAHIGGIGGVLESILPTLLNALFGVVAGALTLAAVAGIKTLWPAKDEKAITD